MFENLVIVENESISKNGDNFYCDNIECKSISEGLSKNFKVLLIGRGSNTKRFHKINLKNFKISSNIFIFLFNILRTLTDKKTKYLLINLSPFTFFAGLFLSIFRKKFFVYLRSNGYEEYRCILGILGPFLYHVMFTLISWRANLISCRSHILRGKPGKIVSPSQLSEKWFFAKKDPDLKKIQLLYVGRVKVEKGIFSLLKILKNLELNFQLSIVGVGKNIETKIDQKNVKLIEFLNKDDSIIKMYDSHNIFILPSFTEGHPQVLDESLSRLRPVIIFEEISHVIGDRKGIFVSKRDSKSLSDTIIYIMNNYNTIQKKIAENTLPTKANFIKEVSNIIQLS